MRDEIAVTWIKPEHWNDLTQWRIDEPNLVVNGYKIPQGFLTDGASIPFPFRGTFNPTGKSFPAAIAHDHRCKRNDYPRKQADIELYRDLIDCGVNKRRAWLMFKAVRGYAVCTGKK